MRSTLAVTHEIYDSSIAADDLAAQIGNFPASGRNACGILFAEPCYDWDTFLPALSQRLDIDIIGCTATAQISSQGYHTLSATLLVLGDKDCSFSTAATPALDETNGEHHIREAFVRAKECLSTPGFEAVFYFSASSPGFSEDDRLAVLNVLADGKPVFGAVASDYFESNTHVFHNTVANNGGMVIMLVGGRVKPKFITRNLPTKRLPRSRITSSHATTVHSIDDISALDFMRRHGVDTSNNLGAFFTPMTVEMDNEDDYDGVPVCVPFISFDEENGSGRTFTHVPVGASISVHVIQGSDILDTTCDAMESLMDEIRGDTDFSYEYSTILGVSCAARHIALAFKQEREGELAQRIFPSSLTFASFYSFGEICPTSIRSNRAKNRMHNLSIGLCAL